MSQRNEYGWYAQQGRNFRLERNPDFSRCAMLLNAQISGILAATKKLTYIFVVRTTPTIRLQTSHVTLITYSFLGKTVLQNSINLILKKIT